MLLVALEWIVFGTYFTGQEIPQFDFLSAYNTEAYQWWQSAFRVGIPQWTPTLWGGYPAVSNLQNSSFYLPVGLATLLGPFTLHSSAILSAFHVAFGASGGYIFARRFNLKIAASLLAMIAWFFAAGFYSNAGELDIMRAFAWFPCILLISSTRWPWQKWWGPLLALLFIWQAILASYPGVLVTYLYLLPIWVIGNQFITREKLRRYLIPLAVSGIGAVAMSLIRFLPALTARGTYPGILPDTSKSEWALLGALLFPYNNPALPSFDDMESMFLGAAVVALIAFVPLRIPWVKVLLLIAGVGFLLGLGSPPWHDLVTHLPGMSLSRFRQADFRVVVLFCLVAVAAFSLDQLLRTRDATSTRTKGLVFGRIAAVSALLILFGVVEIKYHYEASESTTQWVLMTLAAAAAVVALLTKRRGLKSAAAAMLIGVAACSGVSAVYAVPGLWRSDRVTTELSYFGSTVDRLIASPASVSDVQRPARIAPPENPTGADTIDNRYSVAFYTGQTSLFGYVNLRGTETYERIKSVTQLPGDDGAQERAFWSAAGEIFESDVTAVPTVASTSKCVASGQCGQALSSMAKSYNSNGHFSYSLVATRPVIAMANEAYYPGWTASICEMSRCHSIVASSGTSGQIVLNIPKGSWTLHLDYRLPHLRLALGLFGFGALSVAMLVVLRAVRRRRVQC